MQKEAGSLKTKKIHDNLNPTTLNQSEKIGKEGASLKTKKNPSKQKPESLNPKAIKWKKKLQV